MQDNLCITPSSAVMGAMFMSNYFWRILIKLELNQ
jgi:hypothetical protein